MAGKKGKRGFSTYILPILFCGLLVALAVLNNRRTEQPLKAVLQEGEPLTLNEQAVENYLYSAGYTWDGAIVFDGDGRTAATLVLTTGTDGAVDGMTLTFPLPAYYASEDPEGFLTELKAKHDEAAQRGRDMFLALFDAVAATDSRVASRRDVALEKLQKTVESGKAATQTANAWRFSFSLEPGQLEGTVTVLCERIQ